MDAFTTWFKKRSKNGVIFFSLPGTGDSWTFPSNGQHLPGWSCWSQHSQLGDVVNFFAPQKLVLVKKGSSCAKMDDLFFFFQKFVKFSNGKTLWVFLQPKGFEKITVWRFSTSRGGQWTFPAREGQCLGQRLYACEVRYHSNGVDKGMMMLM